MAEELDADQLATLQHYKTVGTQMYHQLNHDQKTAAELIVKVNYLQHCLIPIYNNYNIALQTARNGAQNVRRLFYIDGPAGTGKTFLYKCLYNLLMADSYQVY